MIKRIIAVMLVILMCSSASAINFTEGRNMGPNGKLRGNICALVVFVSTPMYPWTESDISKYTGTMYDNLNAISDQAAKYGVSVKLDWKYWQVDLDHEPKAWPDTDWEWYWQLLREFFVKDSMVELQSYWESNLGYDDTPFIFVFNAPGRSYCYEYGTCDTVEEFAIVYYAQPNLQHYATMHEMLHLYGAADLYDYHNEGIQRITDSYFPRTVMRDSTKTDVDAFTAYLIGWTNTPSSYAEKYMAEIRDRR